MKVHPEMMNCLRAGLFLSREILGITGLSIKETGKFGEGARFEIHVPGGKYRFGE